MFVRNAHEITSIICPLSRRERVGVNTVDLSSWLSVANAVALVKSTALRAGVRGVKYSDI
jgi:hypothetical protein